MNIEAKKMDLQMSQSHLIEANKNYWQSSPSITEGSSWIYVLHTLTTAVLPCVHEDIVAKGLQEKEKLPIVSVVSGKTNEFLDKLDESFGIEQRFHSSYHEFDSDAEKQKVEQLAEELSSATYGDKEKLLGLTYRGIACGDVIYDDILRRGKTGKRGEVFDCFDISRERYFVFIRNALTVIDKAYKMFEERQPRYLVTAEYVYTKGLYASVALALGAKILFAPIEDSDIVVQMESKHLSLQDFKISDISKNKGVNYLQQYKQQGTVTDDFFVYKPSIEVTNLMLPLHEESERKKVFILPHALCDAPRQGCRHNIYHDYNEWLLDTIRIVKEVPDVDWIIKDHPWSKIYGQCDYIQSVFEKSKAPNLYLCGKEYSGMKIKEVADCVLTCAGDAGIEYWAYGIPTITTADAYYCDWGISYQMRSLKEYENTLKHIKDIKPPLPESVKFAKKYIQAVKGWRMNEDSAGKLFTSFRKKEFDIFKSDGICFENSDWRGSRLEETTCEFCEAYVQFLQTEDLKSSAIYNLDNIWKL